MKNHKACYGELFPSRSWRGSGKERADGIFGYVYQQPGTVALPPGISVDLEEWDRCTECREFSTCWQLSAAKALVEMSVRN